MPPTPFEPRILLDAATDYNAIRSYTEDVIRWLATALDTYSACAGSDNAGKDWAELYDRTAIDAGAFDFGEVSVGCIQIARIFVNGRLGSRPVGTPQQPWRVRYGRNLSECLVQSANRPTSYSQFGSTSIGSWMYFANSSTLS